MHILPMLSSILSHGALMNNFGVSIVDQACFPGIPGEVKQDLFCTLQLLFKEGSGTPLDPWSLVMVLPRAPWKSLVFLTLK